jgi:hypothetical protein
VSPVTGTNNPRGTPRRVARPRSTARRPAGHVVDSYGGAFTNQGDRVSFVATGGKTPADGYRPPSSTTGRDAGPRVGVRLRAMDMAKSLTTDPVKASNKLTAFRQ